MLPVTTDSIESNEITQTKTTESRPSTFISTTGAQKTTSFLTTQPKLSTYRTQSTENSLPEGREDDEILLATETNAPESSTSEEFAPTSTTVVTNPGEQFFTTGSGFEEKVLATTNIIESRDEEIGTSFEVKATTQTTQEDAETGTTSVTRPDDETTQEEVDEGDFLTTEELRPTEEFTERERSSEQYLTTLNTNPSREGENLLPEVIQEATTTFSLQNPTSDRSELSSEVEPDFSGTTTTAEESTSEKAEEATATERGGVLPEVVQEVTTSQVLQNPTLTYSELRPDTTEFEGTTAKVEEVPQKQEEESEESEVVKRSPEIFQIRTLEEYFLSSAQAKKPQEVVLPDLFVPHTPMLKEEDEPVEAEDFIPRTWEEYFLLNRAANSPIKFTTELAFKKSTPSRKTRTIAGKGHVDFYK